MNYAYLDESGTVTPFNTAECFLVIAIVAGSYGVSRRLQHHLKKLRKKARLPVGEELKASLSSHRQRVELLQSIASEDIAIVAVILDKRYVVKPPDDPEDWYREVASLAVWHCLQRWPELSLITDKRYTKLLLRDKLDKAIQGKAGEAASVNLTIQQVDSRTSLELQAVDFVAWSLARKYAEQDQVYYELIKDKIIVEQVVMANEKRATP